MTISDNSKEHAFGFIVNWTDMEFKYIINVKFSKDTHLELIIYINPTTHYFEHNFQFT